EPVCGASHECARGSGQASLCRNGRVRAYGVRAGRPIATRTHGRARTRTSRSEAGPRATDRAVLVKPSLRVDPSALLVLERTRDRCDRVAGMRRSDRLEQCEPALLPRDRPVSDTLRHDVHVTGAERYGLLTFDLDDQRAPQNEKHLVFLLVRVPHEVAARACDLHIVIIDPADDSWREDLV